MTDNSFLSIRFSTELADYLTVLLILLLAIGLSALVALWSHYRIKKNPDNFRGNSWNPVIRSTIWIGALGYSFTRIIIIPSDGWWIFVLLLLVMIFIGMAGPLRNMISGFWISAGRYLAPGDHISVGLWSGEVTATGVFYVTLIDDNGRLIRIPNQECFRQSLVISPPNDLEKLEMMVHVPAGNLSDPVSFLLECVLSSPWCSLKRPPVVTRTESQSHGFVSYRIEAWAVSREKSDALKGDILAFADKLKSPSIMEHGSGPSR